MIRNDRQFRIVSSRIDRLMTLDGELEGRLSGAAVDSAKAAFERQAVHGEIARMKEELKEYEDLRDGRAAVGTAKTLEELPSLLIRARIAAGLTQAELAARLGLKEQQIQRYEATDYESASLTRLKEVSRALETSVDFRLSSPARAS